MRPTTSSTGNQAMGRSTRPTGTDLVASTARVPVASNTRASLGRSPLPLAMPILACEQLSSQALVKGFVYASGEKTPRSSLFRLKSGVTLDFGGRTIPDVRVDKFSRVPSNTIIHHVFITYQGRVFLVYGFHRANFPLNGAVMGLKKTTAWRGDVVVFSVGILKPLLKAPVHRKGVVDAVVSMVTEALDMGRQVPSIIEA